MPLLLYSLVFSGSSAALSNMNMHAGFDGGFSVLLSILAGGFMIHPVPVIQSQRLGTGMPVQQEVARLHPAGFALVHIPFQEILQPQKHCNITALSHCHLYPTKISSKFYGDVKFRAVASEL